MKWIGYVRRSVGVSPSGKAPVFGIGIPRFESWHPSHFYLSDVSNARRKKLYYFFFALQLPQF